MTTETFLQDASKHLSVEYQTFSSLAITKHVSYSQQGYIYLKIVKYYYNKKKLYSILIFKKIFILFCLFPFK